MWCSARYRRYFPSSVGVSSRLLPVAAVGAARSQEPIQDIGARMAELHTRIPDVRDQRELR